MVWQKVHLAPSVYLEASNLRSLPLLAGALLLLFLLDLGFDLDWPCLAVILARKDWAAAGSKASYCCCKETIGAG